MENKYYWSPTDTNFLLKEENDLVYYLHMDGTWNLYPYRLKSSKKIIAHSGNIPRSTKKFYSGYSFGIKKLNKVLFYSDLLSDNTSL